MQSRPPRSAFYAAHIPSGNQLSGQSEHRDSLLQTRLIHLQRSILPASDVLKCSSFFVDINPPEAANCHPRLVHRSFQQFGSGLGKSEALARIPVTACCNDNLAFVLFPLRNVSRNAGKKAVAISLKIRRKTAREKFLCRYLCRPGSSTASQEICLCAGFDVILQARAMKMTQILGHENRELGPQHFFSRSNRRFFRQRD